MDKIGNTFIDLIEIRFNDWNREVTDIDHQTRLLLRHNLNNALIKNITPSQTHLLEKIHSKTCVSIFSDPVSEISEVIHEQHMNIYKEPRHG